MSESTSFHPSTLISKDACSKCLQAIFNHSLAPTQKVTHILLIKLLLFNNLHNETSVVIISDRGGRGILISGKPHQKSSADVPYPKLSILKNSTCPRPMSLVQVCAHWASMPSCMPSLTYIRSTNDCPISSWL